MPPKKSATAAAPPAPTAVTMDNAVIMGPGSGSGSGPVVGVAAPVDDEGGVASKELVFREGMNIEDLNLPKSIVTRLAKGVLPPNTQIQGNAMLALTKSATVFVNYIASQANEYAASSNRKTINPQDVFAALDEAQLSDFRPRLEAELTKFNEIQSEKRNAYKSKVASKSDKLATTDEPEEREDGARASKKQRLNADTEADESAMDVTADEPKINDEEKEGEEGDETEEDEEDEEEGEGEAEGEGEEEERDEEEKDEALDNGEDSE